jgi:hypothetical protein
MRNIGIYSRLDQVFDAPNAVREVLTGQCGLDRSVSPLSFPFQFMIYLTMWSVSGAEPRVENWFLIMFGI